MARVELGEIMLSQGITLVPYRYDLQRNRDHPYMDAPEFARLSIHDGSKVKIAPVHSDFDCGLRRGP